MDILSNAVATCEGLSFPETKRRSGMPLLQETCELLIPKGTQAGTVLRLFRLRSGCLITGIFSRCQAYGALVGNLGIDLRDSDSRISKAFSCVYGKNLTFNNSPNILTDADIGSIGLPIFKNVGYEYDPGKWFDLTVTLTSDSVARVESASLYMVISYVDTTVK